MSYKAEGTITHLATQAKQISDKFAVREFAIETGEQYPQSLKFQCVNDKTSILDAVAIGEVVTVEFDIRGRVNNDGRIFNNLQAWRVTAGSASVAAPAEAASGGGGFDDPEIPFAAVPWGATL